MSSPSTGGRSPRRVPTEALVPREARAFQGNRAGFVTRLLANVLDLLAVTVLLLLGYGAWVLLRLSLSTTGVQLPSLGPAVLLAAGFAVAWLYLTSAWSTTGRTFGCRVMGIRVVGFRGRVMRLPGAAARAALCLAFMPGLLWVLVSKENRSLQDTVLRTSVIHDWTRRPQKREPGRGNGSVTDVP